MTSQGSPKCTNVHFAVHLFLQVILHFLQMNSINRNWFNETYIYDSCCLTGPCILLLLMWLVATFSVGLVSHHLYMTLFIAANGMKKWTNWTALMKRHALPIKYCACLPLLLSRETWWENNMGWGMTGSDSSSECNTFQRCISLKMHLLHQQCSYTKLLTGLFNGDQGTQLRRAPADTYRTWTDICTEQITLCDCNTE